MKKNTDYLLIIGLALILFVPFLGQVHLFDWDEINFAECAREMLATKEYLRVQINYLPFWEKPPLFIWLQAVSMKLFGINEFAARFPNAIVGLFTLLIIYAIGFENGNRRRAWLGVWLFTASWLPHLYFKSGIIDPLFNLFIFLSIYQLFKLENSNHKFKTALYSGLFLGLALLTKGPVAGLIVALCAFVFLIAKKNWKALPIKYLTLLFISSIMVYCIWLSVEVYSHGWGLLKEFIAYQIRLFSTEDADHGGFLMYHFVVLLMGCFPASLFLFYTNKNKTSNANENNFTLWMRILFWVVLLLFTIVKTKIVHYSSLCYFPLILLAAQNLDQILIDKNKTHSKRMLGLVFIGGLIAFALIVLPILGINSSKFLPYIHDEFAKKNMAAQVLWSYNECTIGVLYLVGLFAVAYIWKFDHRKAIQLLCFLQLLIIQISLYHFTPKIEKYTQGSAIEFYQSKANKDVYVQVLDFKSYAYLFYTQKPKPTDTNSYNDTWLINKSYEKPTFFVTKITEMERYSKMPQLKLLYEKNGFAFFQKQ